ncbi:histidinol-phosphatase [Malaciobacter marinus]|uniref:Histidinol-phosphatase n=1 Tax=Malaciobacter marinus TaxID=505249 RepID=A0A347TN70_9BACT|nr:histidinol-phosphatase [Malaciobacter marinus]AXX88048.1 histidinol-phosphate phosphatase [Malaciobacter marinus]PHO16096.1 histidinol phosphate phosphatase [Malaciobacter marinus]
MRVDLHNHTILCNHAQGSVEDFIKRAIELKIDYYGFTEHAPMNFDEKYRMKLTEKEFYETTIKYYKEKYINDINILLGYEVDFMQSIPILDEILSSKVDYLIGSVHFLESKNENTPWGFDNPEFIGKYKNKDIDLIWIDYFEAIRLLAKTGHFDIVGHLDLIKVFKFLPTKDIKLIALEALKQIKKSNMTIEINAAGFRKPIKEQYPCVELLQLAYELDIDITFSSDAHAVDQIGYAYDEVVLLAKSIGYTKCTVFRQREKLFVDF